MVWGFIYYIFFWFQSKDKTTPGPNTLFIKMQKFSYCTKLALKFLLQNNDGDKISKNGHSPVCLKKRSMSPNRLFVVVNFENFRFFNVCQFCGRVFSLNVLIKKCGTFTNKFLLFEQ